MPIGLLFSIIGVIITIFGFITKGSEMYRHSLYININLYSGICLLVFGLLMTVLALNAQKKNKK
jgi:uncharacterized membrane protein YidH (DUF202 family)